MHRQPQCEDVAQDGPFTPLEQVSFLLDRIAQLTSLMPLQKKGSRPASGGGVHAVEMALPSLVDIYRPLT